MKLSDLTPAQRRILRQLFEAQELTRAQLIKLLCQKSGKMQEGTVGSSLTRLESYGLVDRPEALGGPWSITLDGARLFAPAAEPECVDPPCPEPEPQDVPHPEPEPEEEEETDEPDLEPDDLPEFEDLQAAPAHLSQEVIGALEVEIALHHVRAKLAMPLVPARSTRVYRQIVECLPEPLVEALRPITELVEGLQ